MKIDNLQFNWEEEFKSSHSSFECTFEDSKGREGTILWQLYDKLQNEATSRGAKLLRDLADCTQLRGIPLFLNQCR